MSTPADEILRRLASLSLAQKVRLLTGTDLWTLPAEPAVGLRSVVFSDGPAGVRGALLDERDPSANVPSPTALAASWDEAHVERLGRLLGAQARRKGVDVFLAPTVNLHRTPHAGRHFEYFSEDPLLTGRIAAAYVRGVQGEHRVAATVKHFVANDSETERMTLDARVDERTLRELYLAPFEYLVRTAGVWAVMAAYNAVNGHPMTESPLLTDVLKDEWGFDGVVVSDWNAARRTRESATAGLDVVMPGPAGPWGDALTEAVRVGDVPEKLVDDKVHRVLRLADRVGALAAPLPPSPVEDDVARVLRTTATAGFVLARNHDLLPLDPRPLRRIAVLGPNAVHARTQGGGSATVQPPYTVSPVDGLRAAVAGRVRVDAAPGVGSPQRVPPAAIDLIRAPNGSAGVEVRLIGADGGLLRREHRANAALIWLGSFGGGLAADTVRTIEIETVVRAPEAGTYRIGVTGTGTFRLTVGEQVTAAQSVAVQLAAGEEIRVLAVNTVQDIGSGPLIDVLLWLLVDRLTDDDEELARAEALAAEADVAVVVVGTTSDVESEGFDRESLALPGRQDELVRRVAAVNPNTVVVVNSGAPVLLPWRDDVRAVLLAWFPGQEFGHALADVLFGDAEPGGRLPVVWPADGDGPIPSVRPVDGVLTYSESIHIGQRAYDRAGVAPAYPFGHGLGYTIWEYLGVAGHPGGVRVRVRNAGPRTGREVVQVYASRPDSAVDRPVRWLAGFATVEATAGTEVTVEVALAERVFQHWDAGWRLEPGEFTLTVGRSATDVRLTTTYTP